MNRSEIAAATLELAQHNSEWVAALRERIPPNVLAGPQQLIDQLIDDIGDSPEACRGAALVLCIVSAVVSVASESAESRGTRPDSLHSFLQTVVALGLDAEPMRAVIRERAAQTLAAEGDE